MVKCKKDFLLLFNNIYACFEKLSNCHKKFIIVTKTFDFSNAELIFIQDCLQKNKHSITFIETKQQQTHIELTKSLDLSICPLNSTFFFKNLKSVDKQETLDEKTLKIKEFLVHIDKDLLSTCQSKNYIQNIFSPTDFSIYKIKNILHQPTNSQLFYFLNPLFLITITKNRDKLNQTRLQNNHKYEIYSLQLNYFSLKKSLEVFYLGKSQAG